MKKYLTKPLSWLLAAGVILVVLAVYLVYQNVASKTADQVIAEASQLYSEQKFDKAAALYERSIDRAGLVNNPEAWNNYANILRELNKYDQAEQAYLRAISIDQLYEISFRNLISLDNGRSDLTAELKADKLKALALLLERAIAAKPDSVALVEDAISTYRILNDQANADKYQSIRSDLLLKLDHEEGN